jgi:hypothetical protein
LGRNLRRVLLFAWLTLLPVSTPLPVITQRRAMVLSPQKATGPASPAICSQLCK